jgi:hypothetical protein
MPKSRGNGTNHPAERPEGGAKEGEGKRPAKPISLYPMSEEEALKRLLRVPPPAKGKAACEC